MTEKKNNVSRKPPMPYAKKTRSRRALKGRKTRRRTYRPRRSLRRKTLNWKKLTVGFPKTMLVKMRYCETVSLNPVGSQTTYAYQYRANDCYDPDFTGGGHQPYTFDQFAPLYENVFVVGSKCTVRYTPTATTSSNIAAMLSITCDTNSRGTAAYPSYSALMEKAPGKKIMVGQHYTNGSFWDRKQSVSATFSPRKLFNMNISKWIANSNNACTYTSSTPADSCAYYNINLIDIDGGNPDAMTFTVTIDYVCILTGRLTTSQS